MVAARVLLVAFVAAVLAGCAPAIPELNQRPTKYYQQAVSFRGRVSRMQRLDGETLLEVADPHEHRILVRVPTPVDVGVDDWVKVKGVLVPEARVGGRVVYDVVMAESVDKARAPWLGWLL
jgi:uncharacterized membrane protein YcgQ (UPF0703/DUF1980 family)